MIKIHAHRGGSTETPENTMSAFQRALELEADVLEIDIHLLLESTLKEGMV